MGQVFGSGEASSFKVEEIISRLGSDKRNGLGSSEAESRLKIHGKNTIELEKGTGFLGVFIKELREPMILLLVIIAILYSILGDPRDSVTIVVIVLLVVAIETYNLNKARVSIDALKVMRMPMAKAIRDGMAKDVKTSNVVPGDILILSSGDIVPADGRLLESHTLKLDESSLTGESYYVLKDAGLVPVTGELVDLANMVFSGTLVVQGSGKFIATSTGKNTELGKVARLIKRKRTKEKSVV